jgi:hypothetical protein
MKIMQIQPKHKQIQELTLRELDMVYSLVRIGDWPDSEIGRVYKLAEKDVRKVFDSYVELREIGEKNHDADRLPKEPSLELTTKPRKRRTDARFATAAERQAAYRNRLQEKLRADIEQPARAIATDMARPADKERFVTVCQDPMMETSSEKVDPQQPINSLPEKCYGTSENIADPVTAKDSDDDEVLEVNVAIT